MTKQALIIGIDEYKSQPLNGCVADAKAIAKSLNYNSDTDKTLNFDIKLLENIKTKASLRSMIRTLFNSDADIALLYFSGHGYIDESGGYIVTPDGIADDPGISMDEILNLANRSYIKTKIIILDCCNSGAFGAPANLSEGAYLSKGMTIMTSSRENETSVEIDGHGVFTRLLLHALNGGAADLMGYITPGSVYAHIDRAIGNWGQRPTFRTNVIRFTPLKKVKPLIDPEVLNRIITYFPRPDDMFPLNPSFEWSNEDIADSENIKIFTDLQSMNRVGLVIPQNADPNHMYYAAMQSKSCCLTQLGHHYWQLIKNNKFNTDSK